MATLYITNAFSINMLSKISNTLEFNKISQPEIVINLADNIIGCIGHENTALLVEQMLKGLGYEDIPKLFNRISITPDFKAGDEILVCQYTGPRLDEGVTSLPDGAKINFWVVIAP